MPETIHLPLTKDRAALYAALLPQIEALISGETDLVANQANIVAAIKEVFGFLWIGFYRVKENQLVLGPFQGPIACTRIAFNRGVCGHAYTTKKTVLVPNVDEFPGHIACSSAARSEVVVPIMMEGAVVGVLDVDSAELDDFTTVDVKGLEAVVRLLEKTF